MTLTIVGTAFDSNAQVWLDLDRDHPVRLHTLVQNSTTLRARAPAWAWRTRPTVGNSHVFVRQNGTTTSYATLNYYAACGPGRTNGGWLSFTGSTNGVVVWDANHDQIRFRNNTRQLVIDGWTLDNTVCDHNAIVRIDGQGVGKVYLVTADNGQPVAVLGSMDGTHQLDQTRGAAGSPAGRHCRFSLGETAFGLTPMPASAIVSASARLGETGNGAGAAFPAPCPSLELSRGTDGSVTALSSNLVPGRAYVTLFRRGRTACDHPSLESTLGLPAAFDSGGWIPISWVADRTGHAIRHPVPAPDDLEAVVFSLHDGAFVCGSAVVQLDDGLVDVAAESLPATSQPVHNTWSW